LTVDSVAKTLDVMTHVVERDRPRKSPIVNVSVGSTDSYANLEVVQVEVS
jgi:hypothetical protein